MRELRRDPITQRWVLISTDYQKDWSGEECPFCPGNEAMTPPEIFATGPAGRRTGGPGWFTRVVSNKFPYLRIEGEMGKRGRGIYDVMNGIGAHEIVVETSDHSAHWSDFDQVQVERILYSYRARLRDLRGDKRFRFILIVKNHDLSTGILNHPHSNIIALPIVPFRIEEEIQGGLEHFRLKERCIYCDVIQEEKKARSRLILETDRYLVFVPFSAKYSFETWILPKEHIPDFGDPGVDLAELAFVFHQAMWKIKHFLKDPPYGFVLHTSPNPPRYQEHYHWHFELRPKVFEGMGYEWGTGFFITYTAPEKAAAIMRGEMAFGTKE